VRKLGNGFQLTTIVNGSILLVHGHLFHGSQAAVSDWAIRLSAADAFSQPNGPKITSYYFPFPAANALTY
jgi:hypothetical protein